MKKIYLLLWFLINSILSFSQWTWQNPYPTGNALYSVSFTENNIGFSVGENGTILKTNNAGVSWNLLGSGTSADLFSVYLLNSNVGYAGGGEGYFGPGIILKTLNGGTTWTALTFGSDIYSFYFIDDNIGFAVGSGGMILKTVNGGTNWLSLTTGISKDLYSIFFSDANTGYAVGGGNGSGTLLKTIDGGTSWTDLSSYSLNILRSVYFTDVNTGYTVAEVGKIYKTFNGGLDWTVVESSFSSLNSIFFYRFLYRLCSRWIRHYSKNNKWRYNMGGIIKWNR